MVAVAPVMVAPVVLVDPMVAMVTQAVSAVAAPDKARPRVNLEKPVAHYMLVAAEQAVGTL